MLAEETLTLYARVRARLLSLLAQVLSPLPLPPPLLGACGEECSPVHQQAIRRWDEGKAQAGRRRGLRLMLPEAHS